METILFFTAGKCSIPLFACHMFPHRENFFNIFLARFKALAEIVERAPRDFLFADVRHQITPT